MLEVGATFTNGRDPVSHRRTYKPRKKVKKNSGAHKWSPEQRAKFMRTMKGVWKRKKAEEKAAEK